MPNLILHTCGTSLFTNGIANELRQDFFKYSNVKAWQDIPEKIKCALQKHIQAQQQKLLEADEALVKKISAELNSFLTWQHHHVASKQDVHLLLATDTALGQATAAILQEWLTSKGYICVSMSSSGLNTANFQSFRESLSDLTKQLVEQVSSYKESGYQIIFNLTGGFKSLNGFLQALSTIYADETFYLFESSHEVLSIPKLPFSFNTREVILNALTQFRRLAADLKVNKNDLSNMSDILFFEIDGDYTLSEWGSLIWQSGFAQLYREKLYPSISNRIIFGHDFEKSTKDLDPAIVSILNHRLDDLAVYTENDCKQALKSLDPKPLQEKQYKDQNLWECDLDPHHRIFMKKDGYTFTLERVNKALH